jgi:hypothetical protein
LEYVHVTAQNRDQFKIAGSELQMFLFLPKMATNKSVLWERARFLISENEETVSLRL